ncbi:hypothetical protein PMI16_01363 [Herbaspirillum sp. CF444]|jgi:hypothetical protein|uniref:hypothetical protein n=1 Tax=Herbaspirillum sp. CF444 TaxID=1144319 RepID=UPI0002724B9B|nr:hypothetical protein [Herbaspirillum sp. CF444]EJL91874.1 hypothetical protein PMI16_01363 [Herbaspirillum sp. CF444]
MTASGTARFSGSSKFSIRALLIVASSLVTMPGWAQETSGSSVQFDAALFAQQAATKGVVLMSADWSRHWGCARYENAQLQFLAFDKNGVQKTSADGQWDVMIKDGSILPSKKNYGNYAFIVEPGEYLLTGFRIKLGKSVSNVGNFYGDRKNMLENGKSKGGSFTVAAGEIVYIGHFSLDCAKAPMPWRFYPETREDFSKYLDEIRQEYPGIDKDKVQFRLFETTIMGYPFSLP